MSRGNHLEQIGPEAVHAATRVVLVAFTAFTLLATSTLLGSAAATDRYFAWTIRAEPNSAFLGAAYAAGFVLSVLALRRDRWGQIRVGVVTVTVFAVLTLAATSIHMHRLHLMTGGPMARFAAWVWLTVYILISVACLIVVGRQERRWRASEVVRRPMPGWLTVVLAAQGVILCTAGAVLFFGDATVHHMAASSTGFWPWPLTPLTAQAIGAWLLSMGFAAGAAIWQRDLSRLLLPALTYAAFGAFELLVALRYRNEMSADDPWLWAYVTLLVTIVATGGYGWWVARRPVEAARARRPPRRAALRAGTPAAHL
jgi:hypothetical protein